MISERGPDDVRMADVAERAGMSPGHLTYYYGTKSDLLMAAVRSSEDRYLNVVLAELRTIDDPWERLVRLVELAAAQAPGDPGWQLWFEVWSAADGAPSVADVHEELDRRWRDAIADVIRDGCRRGTFPEVDPELTSRLLSSVIDGLSFQLTCGAVGVDRERVVRWVMAGARIMLGLPSEDHGSHSAGTDVVDVTPSVDHSRPLAT